MLNPLVSAKTGVLVQEGIKTQALSMACAHQTSQRAESVEAAGKARSGRAGHEGGEKALLPLSWRKWESFTIFHKVLWGRKEECYRNRFSEKRNGIIRQFCLVYLFKAMFPYSDTQHHNMSWALLKRQSQKREEKRFQHHIDQSNSCQSNTAKPLKAQHFKLQRSGRKQQHQIHPGIT